MDTIDDKIFFSIVSLNCIIENDEPPCTKRYKLTIEAVENILQMNIKIIDPILWRDILLEGFGYDAYIYHLYQLKDAL